MEFEQLLSELQQFFPANRLLVDAGELVPYESDGLTAFATRPRAVVIVESADEIVRTVSACHRTEVPFVARGSGTSLSGGSLPNEDGIIIALNRMNRILRMEPRKRIAVVEPGVVNLAISKSAAAHGLYYAPDPSSQQICTIGGNVAFNSGGAHCLKYGMTSNHVLGMKVVLADGTIVCLGGESLEHVGPDGTGLFVGSEGLFGIALEITVRLLPIPETFHTVLAGYATLEQAGDAVTSIVSSGLLPGALEIMDRLTMQAAEAAVQSEYPSGAEAVLIVELDGSTDHIEAEKLQLQALIEASNPCAVVVAQNATQRAAIWRGRKSAFSAVGRLSPDFIVQDGVVPRAKLGFALRQIESLSKKFGLRVGNVFHAGDGNLHPLILYDGRESGAFEKAEELAGQIVQLCIELGGSITGEHGVGMEKRQFLPRMFGAEDVRAMVRIRQAIDPHEVANRGKMFPTDEAPSLSLYGLHPLEKAGVISRE
jgi:glycolate oxidase